MRVLTVEQMRAADRAAVAEAHIPEMLLMTRAGTALARVAARVAALRGTMLATPEVPLEVTISKPSDACRRSMSCSNASRER